MFTGFRGREYPHPVRIHHRVTDEQRLHPPRRRRAGSAAEREDEISEASPVAGRDTRDGRSAQRERHLEGAHRDVGYLDLAGCMALGITGPILRSTGLPHDLRKSEPYCGYENYEFDVITADGCDAYGRYIIRVNEMWESVRSSSSAWTSCNPARPWSRTARSPGRPT